MINLSIPNYSEKYLKKQNSSFTITKQAIKRNQSGILISFNKKANTTYLEKMRKLFEYYSQIGESVYTTKMNIKKFIKLCNDMFIIDKNLSKEDLELLTIRILTKKKSLIDFENFQKLLHEISKYKENNKILNHEKYKINNINNKNYIKLFLNNSVIKLYNKIFKNDNTLLNLRNDIILNENEINNNILRIDNINIDENYEIFLKLISVPMFEIYKKYFILEFDVYTPNEYSIKQFIKFSNDFEFFPFLINKDELLQIYEKNINLNINECFKEIIKLSLNTFYHNLIDNYGNNFNFFKFLTSIFEIGNFGLSRINECIKHKNDKKIKCEYSTFEKICLICERMELTEIFSKLNFKPYIINNIIDNDFLEKIKQKIKIRENILFDNLNIKTKQNLSLIIDDSDLSFLNYNYIINKYSKELKFIFNLYSDESISLKKSGFIKILNDSELIKRNTNSIGITITEADLLYIYITNIDINYNKKNKTKSNTISKNHSFEFFELNNNNNNYNNDNNNILISPNPCKQKSKQSFFTFEKFICSIELLSKKIFPNEKVKNSIDYIITTIINHICQEYFNQDNLLDLIYKEKDENLEFNRVYEIFYQSIYPLFNIYSNKNNIITLKKLIQFSTDFNLFPELITKSKLITLFKKSYLYYNDNNNEMNGEEGLNQIMFCDLLIQIAFEIHSSKKESNDIEKIIFFIERLSESDGMNKILQSLLSSTKLVYGKNFDILSLFKEYYPSYFSNLKNNDDDDIYKKVLFENVSM